MWISFGSATAILPFAIYRLSQHDWLVGIIDLVMVTGMYMLGFYVYISRKTSYGGVILSVLALTGVCMVVYLKGPTLVYWAYPALVGMYFVVTPKMALLLFSIGVTILIPIVAINEDLTITLTILSTLIVNNLFAFFFALGMQRKQDQLVQLVRHDQLTGAGSRRALDEKLQEVIEIVNRVPQHLSLIVIDVDHFKLVNDNFGHAVGDQVLINLVTCIKDNIRATDSLYRLGGEEFVVLASGGEVQCAHHVAEKLRALVSKNVLLDGQPITISLGVAEYIKDETADSWLNRADEALYKAKKSGRNIACYAD